MIYCLNIFYSVRKKENFFIQQKVFLKILVHCKNASHLIFLTDMYCIERYASSEYNGRNLADRAALQIASTLPSKYQRDAVYVPDLRTLDRERRLALILTAFFYTFWKCLELSLSSLQQ